MTAAWLMSSNFELHRMSVYVDILWDLTSTTYGTCAEDHSCQNLWEPSRAERQILRGK